MPTGHPPSAQEGKVIVRAIDLSYYCGKKKEQLYNDKNHSPRKTKS